MREKKESLCYGRRSAAGAGLRKRNEKYQIDLLKTLRLRLICLNAIIGCNELMDPIDRANFTVFAMWQQHRVIEIDHCFVSVVFVVKESSSKLTKYQRCGKEQHVDLIEYGSGHTQRYYFRPSVKCLLDFSWLNFSLLNESDLPFGIDNDVNASPLIAFAW